MNETPKKFDAVLALRPNGGFSVSADGVVKYLHEGDPEPTEEAIQAKLAELQADYDAKKYQRDRAVAYPSIQDQLDKIYHSGLTAWKADIKAVKDKYPKPK